jgi:hypothetical protein
MLAAIRTMKSLNPEVVVPGHGSFGTTKIFDDSQRYYELLLERVGSHGARRQVAGPDQTRAAHARVCELVIPGAHADEYRGGVSGGDGN